MASKSDTVKDKSTSSKEPVLKFNLEEFREMRELESAGNIIGVQDLKKRVRQRMEEELASSGLANSLDGKKAKQVKSTTTTSTSIVDGGNNFLVKNAKDTVVNQKRLETIVSTSSKKNNILNNEDKKVVVKKEKSLTTNILKSTGESLTVNKVKHGVNKEKPKSSASAPKFTRGNGNLTSNKGKQASVIHQERLTSLTPISKSTSVNLSNNNNKGKAKQTTTSKDFGCDLSINNGKRSIVNKESKELVKCVERWKLLREKGGIYRPLESFLPTEILNDKVQMVTVDKIAKEFELKRLRRLLDQDKERQNGNKKLAQERIDHLNNFGKDYTRLEIAAVRNDKGPKKEQQIRAFIAFLNEKNIIKNKKVTKLDIIEDPNYLKRGFEQFKEERLIKQNKEKIVQKDLGKKRKLERISEFNLQFRDKSEQGKHNQQKSKVERKSEGKLLDQRDQRRNQERIAETKKLQEEVQRRRNRVAEESHPKHSNAQKKVIANRNEVSTLKKRKFDDRSEPASSQAQKRRNVEHSEIDFCRLDEETVNRNLSSIIHSLVRPGRRPIYGIVDDNDDDAMEVSGFEVFREEARSSRIARKEDDEEERAEQLRRMKRLKIKKAQDKR